MGLSTVYGIVKQSGGNIRVYSEPGRGTTFKVYLPQAEGATAAPSPSEAVGDRQEVVGTILVVEDDHEVRDLITTILQRTGYTILAAGDVDEAMEMSRQHTENIHLLLTDVMLPKMGGRELADALVSQRPDLDVLYMSGYTDSAISHQGVLDPAVAFLQKPISSNQLLKKVRETLSK